MLLLLQHLSFNEVIVHTLTLFICSLFHIYLCCFSNLCLASCISKALIQLDPERNSSSSFFKAKALSKEAQIFFETALL